MDGFGTWIRQFHYRQRIQWLTADLRPLKSTTFHHSWRGLCALIDATKYHANRKPGTCRTSKRHTCPDVVSRSGTRNENKNHGMNISSGAVPIIDGTTMQPTNEGTYISRCRIKIVNKFARYFDKRSELLTKTATMINVGLIFAVSVLAATEILGVSYWYIEDAYFDRLSPQYIDVNTSNLEVVWINSTLSGVAINVTTLKEMPRGTMAHFNMFEKKNGGYTAHSGISVSQPWCKVITDPLFIGSLLRAMNLAQCPVPPGTYSIAEYHPTADSVMSGYLPSNQYRVSFLVRTKRTIFLQANVFVSLT